MNIEGKVVAITGGASGIGRAMARAFKAAGAKGVAVADMNEDGVLAVAGELGGYGQKVDVSSKGDILSFIANTEAKLGPIDIFCSNAGIGSSKKGSGDEVAPDSEWELMWGVHLKSHVYAAEALADKMAERGEGYLVNTASAAGLLTTVTSAPYTVTKTAAVSYAEWLAIKYAHKNVHIGVLCPQSVKTGMTSDNPNSPAQLSGDMISAEEAAECVLDAVRNNTFLILPHKEVVEYMSRKHGDLERWIRGMARFREKIIAARKASL